ncbi:PREDICTED: tyrosine-protein phosphatase non-receptor type 20 isoform X9 [Mandrillus leucophaeus]|uniref:tyrosine-protein phosphatase non-receptor type 20 isoform X9 n=1 Tax=Mandrillus leucophaeus TaxID=9568 RepID=UPI0005F506D7|nr:PREDICTED: tyrosine-protein phosphatase non-receptor type 20 isoform X9 [Mandrillus leucophaeus]
MGTCLHLGTLDQSLVFEKKVNSEKVKPSLRNFPRNDYEDIFEEPSESGSDPSMWTARVPFRRDRLSSENEEPAGPSHALSPLLSDTHKIVSEGELHQLAQIRPLIFNFHEQTAIKDCLKMLEKKTGAYDIMQEFMALELKNLPGEFNSGNQPNNREKNRYRDILPFQHHGYSGPNERTTFWHDSNKGAVSLLLRYCA